MTIHKRKSKCGRRARIYLWYWPITVFLDFRVCRVSGDVALLIFVDVIDVSVRIRVVCIVVLDVSRVVVSLASCRSYSSERQKTDESHLIRVRKSSNITIMICNVFPLEQHMNKHDRVKLQVPFPPSFSVCSVIKSKAPL